MQNLNSVNSRSRRRSSASSSANKCSPMTCFLFLTGVAFWASLALSFLAAVFFISLTQPNECDCCYAPDTPNGMSRYNNTLCSCETTASSGNSASKCADIISSSCPGRTYITSTLIGWETTFSDVECRTYLATGYAQLVACATTIFMVSIVLIIGYCDFHRLCTNCCRTIMRAITISNCDCHTTKAFNRHIKTKFIFYAVLVLLDFIRTAICVYFVVSTDKKPTFGLVAAVGAGLSGLVAVRHFVGFCYGWYYKAEFVGAGSVSAEHDELLAV